MVENQIKQSGGMMRLPTVRCPSWTSRQEILHLWVGSCVFTLLVFGLWVWTILPFETVIEWALFPPFWIRLQHSAEFSFLALVSATAHARLYSNALATLLSTKGLFALLAPEFALGSLYAVFCCLILRSRRLSILKKDQRKMTEIVPVSWFLVLKSSLVLCVGLLAVHAALGVLGPLVATVAGLNGIAYYKWMMTYQYYLEWAVAGILYYFGVLKFLS